MNNDIKIEQISELNLVYDIFPENWAELLDKLKGINLNMK